MTTHWRKQPPNRMLRTRPLLVLRLEGSAQSPIATEAVERTAPLYAIEEEIRGRSPEKSDTSATIRYALSRQRCGAKNRHVGSYDPGRIATYSTVTMKKTSRERRNLIADRLEGMLILGRNSTGREFKAGLPRTFGIGENLS